MRKTQQELFDRVAEMDHAGGFYTANKREYDRLAKMRSDGLLAYYNGRMSSFWSAQLFVTTEKGRAVRRAA